MPVVMETFDGLLNGIWGQYVDACQVGEAPVCVEPGPVREGSVDGGTGMVCHKSKGGIGSASRRLPTEQGGWTVDAPVQVNHGQRRELRVDGHPVGRRLDDIPSSFSEGGTPGMGSIVVILAIDAPLLPHQRQRLAQCTPIGTAHIGGGIEDSSGDVFLALATGNQDLPLANYARKDLPQSTPLRMLNNDHISPLFTMAAEAVEEAIVNVLLAGGDMRIEDGRLVSALKGETLLVALRRTGWLGR